MLSAYDGSAITLTRKILDRPRLVARIRAAIGDTASAHMSCFNATEDEKLLALQLDIPLYACDPALSWLGGKSGSRAMFRAAGTDLPPGSEDLRDADDIIAALTKLRTDNPTLVRAAVKLNHGASGEGNAAFRFDGAPDAARAALMISVVEIIPIRYPRSSTTGNAWIPFEAMMDAACSTVSLAPIVTGGRCISVASLTC